ncbi:MAG: hypothetical protein HON94_02965 [Methylococcales bacterium]|jgi:O2-independent ubiquinone biosynthesis accessory factor UbiT|nr:hypothetical protein [Methylococcales bacterium]MBT7410846.1 hypothetical protein [Methylococcales bacterium]
MFPVKNRQLIAGNNFAVLPRFIGKIISFPPDFIQHKIFFKALNYFFESYIKEGELAFLEGKRVTIVVHDLFLKFNITLSNQTIQNADQIHSADITIAGNCYELLLLASKKEDADTLFFERRLTMEGNTELGLCIKNFLDSIEIEELKMGTYIEPLMNKTISGFNFIKSSS